MPHVLLLSLFLCNIFPLHYLTFLNALDSKISVYHLPYSQHLSWPLPPCLSSSLSWPQAYYLSQFSFDHSLIILSHFSHGHYLTVLPLFSYSHYLNIFTYDFHDHYFTFSPVMNQQPTTLLKQCVPRQPFTSSNTHNTNRQELRRPTNSCQRWRKLTKDTEFSKKQWCGGRGGRGQCGWEKGKNQETPDAMGRILKQW